MRIEIHAKPIFDVPMSKDLFDALHKCATLHYDLTCRTTVVTGGCLYGVGNHGKFVKSQETVYANWTFREVDLMLKVCEMPPNVLTDGEKSALIDFKRSAMGALHLANRTAHNWTVAYDPTTPTNPNSQSK